MPHNLAKHSSLFVFSLPHLSHTSFLRVYDTLFGKSAKKWVKKVASFVHLWYTLSWELHMVPMNPL